MSTIIKITIALLVCLVLGFLGTRLLLTEQPLGAIAGPDIPSSYLKWGLGHGVRVWANAVPFTTATTTVCAIQSPAATSTLRSAGVRFTVSSTTASLVTLNKSTTAFATTTLIGEEMAVSANAQATIVATTTTAQDEAEVTTFGPNEWFVVGMEGGVGTFSPSGVCHATFEEFATY
jgi:hypothetical protein